VEVREIGRFRPGGRLFRARKGAVQPQVGRRIVPLLFYDPGFSAAHLRQSNQAIGHSSGRSRPCASVLSLETLASR
jgi:hypothetical protein